MRRPLLVAGAVTVAMIGLASPAPALADPAPIAGEACGTTVPVPIANARALSDGGVVGGSGTRDRAVTWDSHTGALRWLGGLEGGLPSQVTAIAANGLVAGRGGRFVAPAGTDWEYHAFRTEGALPLVRLPGGRIASDATAINQANHVVGRRYLGVGSRAYKWGDDAEAELPAPGFGLVSAVDINEADVVVGSGVLWFDPDYPQHLLIWLPDGTLVVPNLQFRSVQAVGIDELTQVTFTALPLDDDVPHLYRWNVVTGLTDLGYPGPGLEAVDSNDFGDVVGHYVVEADQPPRPFLFRPEVGYLVPDIPEVVSLTAVNNAGQVLAQTAAGPVLWTPSPCAPGPDQLV